MLLAAAVLLVYRDMLDGIAIMPSPSLLLVPWFAQLALVPRSTVFGFGVPAVILGMLLILVAHRLFETGGRPGSAQAYNEFEEYRCLAVADLMRRVRVHPSAPLTQEEVSEKRPAMA